MERFWSKVGAPEQLSDVPGMDECWPWTACIRPSGYGAFWLNSTVRAARAHRVAYVLEYGSIPDGLELDHKCRVRHCVRPTHLEPVTNVVNIARGDTGINERSKTQCPRGHEYDIFTTQRKKNGKVYEHRRCSKCQYESQKRSVEKRRLAAVRS